MNDATSPGLDLGAAASGGASYRVLARKYRPATFADLIGGLTMVTARFVPILIVLAVAGSLATKKVTPAGLGTMRTDTPTFGGLVVFTVILVGALTFLPALLLGPTVQGLTDRLF